MAEFMIGDIFVSVSNGQVQWYRPNGTTVTLIDTLNTGLGGFTTGSAFDASNKFYVTAFSANQISVFNTDGTLSGTFGSGYNSAPESIVFDQNGNVYVGQASGLANILKFNADGTLLANFSVARENVGSDWIDLAADQCTIYYTSEGKRVMRFDVCRNEQLPDLTNSLPGQSAFALRIIPETGDILVADSNAVVRINGTTGEVLQTYLSTENLSRLFALNLDPDGTSFWTADINTAEVYKVDILTGDILMQFNTGTGGETVFGLSVNGEITAAIGADLSVTKTDSVDPVRVGENLGYTVTVTNNGPSGATNVTLIDTLPTSVNFISAATGHGSCTEAGGVVTCNLGSLANGDTATVNIEVTPTTVGTITNTASVSATEPDPNPDNNTVRENTTVTGGEPPQITCSGDIKVFNDPGSNGAIVNYPEPVVTSTCPPVTTVCTPQSGSFFPSGNTKVTCTATDACGKSSSCTFNVKVVIDPCRFFGCGCRRRRPSRRR